MSPRSSPGGGDKPVPETPHTTQLPSTPPQKNKSPSKRIHRVRKGSLGHTLRQNAGTSLFVRPICWTDTHTKLIGARFEELPPCNTPVPESIPGSPPSRGHMRPSQTITTLSEALSNILAPEKTSALASSLEVKTILMTLWPNAFTQFQVLPEMHLFFGDRVYRDAVRAQLLCPFPAEVPKSSYSSFKSASTRPADSFNIPSTANSGCASPTNLPMLCYMSKSHLASIRKNLFRVAPGPNRSWNEPVYRLQQLRAKMLIPTNADHDAHLVGIFLAMAQRHFYGTPSCLGSRRGSQWSPKKDKMPKPLFQDLKLRILSHDNDTAEFIVYTAYITAKFLERFHEPHRAPVDTEGEVSGLKIEYARVPIWPILGLRERLGKALGEDIVGQFDPNSIETWDEDESDTEVDPGSETKRKREALSEVFNGSFEEGSEEELVSEKRPRLGEAAPIGLVT